MEIYIHHVYVYILLRHKEILSTSLTAVVGNSTWKIFWPMQVKKCMKKKRKHLSLHSKYVSMCNWNISKLHTQICTHRIPKIYVDSLHIQYDAEDRYCTMYVVFGRNAIQHWTFWLLNIIAHLSSSKAPVTMLRCNRNLLKNICIYSWKMINVFGTIYKHPQETKEHKRETSEKKTEQKKEKNILCCVTRW